MAMITDACDRPDLDTCDNGGILKIYNNKSLINIHLKVQFVLLSPASQSLQKC